MNTKTARKIGKQMGKTIIDALAETRAQLAADRYSFDCARCENTGKNLAGNVGETCWTCQGMNVGTRNQ